MMRKLVLRIVATTAVVLVIAAACGGDDDGGRTTAPPPAPEPAAPAPAPEPAAPEPAAPEPPPPPEPAAPEPEDEPEAAAPEPEDEPEEAAPAPAGGSPAPGVSATEIKLGAISDDGLPLPEIVTIPVVASAVAMFDAVNDEGGVHGRKISVTNCDAAGDIARARACFRKLVDEDQVFSFITSITWGTGSLHQDLARDEIPWFGSWGFYTSEWRNPWMFPTHMATIHEAHANSIWVRDNLDPESVGIIYLNIPEDRLAAEAMHDIFDPAGIEVVIEQPIEIETPDHTPAVIEMQAANPDHVIHFAWAAPMAGWMIAAEQQGYWPPLGVSGNHFAAEALGEFVGDWPLKGMWTITTFKVWNDNTEYLAALEKYNPDQLLKIHHITQFRLCRCSSLHRDRQAGRSGHHAGEHDGSLGGAAMGRRTGLGHHVHLGRCVRRTSGRNCRHGGARHAALRVPVQVQPGRGFDRLRSVDPRSGAVRNLRRL